MLTHEVMVPNPITLDREASVKDAIALMESHGFRHLAITQHGKPFSIVSHREISLVVASLGGWEQISEKVVGDFCALDLISVSHDAEVIDLLEIFIHKKVGAVLVVDNDEFVGVVSVLDICKSFQHLLKNLK